MTGHVGSGRAHPNGGERGTAVAGRRRPGTLALLALALLVPACPLLVLVLFRAAGGAGLAAGVAIAGVIGVALAFGVVRGRTRDIEDLTAGARRAQLALDQREAQLAQALALANMGYWMVDLETRASTWSAEFCRIVGEDPATVRASVEAWWKHVQPEDRAALERNASRAIAEHLPVQDEFRMVRADGKTRWVYGRVQALYDAAGKPVNLIGTVQDVTDQKALQFQFAAAERLATVGTLAAGVAHEINNPLSSVISNLEFVLEEIRRLFASDPQPSAPVMAAASEALQGADRVSAIIRDLMAFSHPRAEAGQVDVERALDLAVNMAVPEIRHHARVVKEYGRVPLARGDASRLGQVFLNVLVNAAQAIPTGRPDDHEIRIATRLQGDRIVVSVRDTGTGMPPEVLRRIFEPFYSTKPVGSGTGLGLYTSLAAVRAMGGDIAAESEPGGGSTFTIVLPSLPLPGAHPPVVAPSGARRARVLIIDDEPLVVAEVARELAAEHEVRHAPDGQAGLDALAMEGPYDVVLCDLEMPGMSGAAVHEALRRRDPETAARMIFLTDGAFTPESRAFLEATRSRLIEKPVSAADVRKLLAPPASAGGMTSGT
jgi:PAS domain S-box-containing protein